MLIIKDLSKLIKEEIHDAEKYAKLALDYKGYDNDLAETFFTLANQELNHMDMLHAQVVRIINEYKARNGAPPPDMLAVYNYVHEEQIEDVQEVRALLNMYRL